MKELYDIEFTETELYTHDNPISNVCQVIHSNKYSIRIITPIVVNDELFSCMTLKQKDIAMIRLMSPTGVDITERVFGKADVIASTENFLRAIRYTEAL